MAYKRRKTYRPIPKSVWNEMSEDQQKRVKAQIKRNKPKYVRLDKASVTAVARAVKKRTYKRPYKRRY